MAISVWCEIVCTHCSDTTEGMFSHTTLPKRKLIEPAKKRGWIFTRDEAFCSRYCMDNWKP